LTNVDNTISGYGTIPAGHIDIDNQADGVINANQSQALAIGAYSDINNDGLIEATGSGGMTIYANTFENGGTIAAQGGSVVVNVAVTGGGSAIVGNGSTLDFAAASDSDTSFIAGTLGVLELDIAASYTGTLTGFGAGDALDLRDLTFGGGSAASYSGTSSGGTLSVTDGTTTDTYTMVGNYLGVTFAVTADGFGGTQVSDASALFGTSGNDTLVASSSAKTLLGLGGTDQYQVGVTGSGATTIINGVDTSTAPAGELLFGSGVATNQLWFDRVDNSGTVSSSGNNLRLDVMGTSQSVTIDGWFNGAIPGAQLTDIKLAGSSLQIDSSVATLVAAMATFEASYQSLHGFAFDPTASANSPITDTAVLAAVGSSWH
ncbi:MAG: hypothetical protein HY060_15125, partial [Proteobacteria bacterium]|nr:hypothetical protein [Pseudomonadota bacterium]